MVLSYYNATRDAATLARALPLLEVSNTRWLNAISQQSICRRSWLGGIRIEQLISRLLIRTRYDVFTVENPESGLKWLLDANGISLQRYELSTATGII